MGGPVDGTKLIQTLKTELMDALMEDPELVLQHCHSLGILSNNEYNNVKDLQVRSRQVRDILDYLIHKDNAHALRFLTLLKREDMQEAFPKLNFLQNLQINKRKTQRTREVSAKRKQKLLENDAFQGQTCITNSRMVTEKEMMNVARCIGSSWKEVAIVALDMSNTMLEQIEEDNKAHTMRVFTMLRKWSMRERARATASRLYSLLTQDENGVDPRSISFLIENS